MCDRQYPDVLAKQLIDDVIREPAKQYPPVLVGTPNCKLRKATGRGLYCRESGGKFVEKVVSQSASFGVIPGSRRGSLGLSFL